MMGSPAPSNKTDPYELQDPFEFSSQQNIQANKLELYQYADQDPNRLYDKDPLIYIYYSIKQKIAVYNRAVILIDTEQDLVLEPAAYQEHFFKAKLNNALLILKKKRPLSSEYIIVVVLAIKHLERLIKRFNDASIKWAVI